MTSEQDVGGGPSRSVPRWLEDLRAHLADLGQDAEAELAEMIAVHETLDTLCPDEDCFFCAWRDCPRRDVFHYHHDGCPSCSRAPRPSLQRTQGPAAD